MGIGRYSVAARLPKVVHGTAVARHKAFKAPLVAQYVLQIAGVAAAGVTVYALVGAHHLGHMAVLNECLESGQIGLPQVALGQ